MKSSANFGIVRKPAESAIFFEIPQIYAHFPAFFLVVSKKLTIFAPTEQLPPFAEGARHRSLVEHGKDNSTEHSDNGREYQ